jgi:hypothetical protein
MHHCVSMGMTMKLMNPSCSLGTLGFILMEGCQQQGGGGRGTLLQKQANKTEQNEGGQHQQQHSSNTANLSMKVEMVMPASRSWSPWL